METFESPVTLKELFLPRKDSMAHGRRCLIYHYAVSAVSSMLASGVFYSAFLLQIGVNVTGISILAFVPYIAALFSLLSPTVLMRFPKRRWVLFAGKLTTYLLQIGGTMLLPVLLKDSSVRTIGFCVLLFLASFIDAVFNPGYLDWHIRFTPDRVRSKFFSVQMIMSNLLPYGISLILAFAADGVKDTPYYVTVIYAIRALALLFALLDCIVLLLPKEFSYETSKMKNILDVFRVPFQNKRFCQTMAIFFFYQVVTSLVNGVSNAYCLTELKLSYTTLNAFNALCGVAALLTSGLWQRLIRKSGWFRCLAYGSFLCVPIYVSFLFMNAQNAAWLFPIIRTVEHIPSVGRGIAAANLLYINTPERDSSYFYSLSTPISNCGLLVGMMLGSLVVGLFGGQVLPIGQGVNYGQFLYGMQAGLSVILGAWIFFSAKKLDPTYTK